VSGARREDNHSASVAALPLPRLATLGEHIDFPADISSPSDSTLDSVSGPRAHRHCKTDRPRALELRTVIVASDAKQTRRAAPFRSRAGRRGHTSRLPPFPDKCRMKVFGGLGCKNFIGGCRSLILPSLCELQRTTAKKGTAPSR